MQRRGRNKAADKGALILINVLGVKQLIVGINKMDVSNFNQQKYETIKVELTALLKQLGFKTRQRTVRAFLCA